jgi:signal transduction histidine kinase
MGHDLRQSLQVIQGTYSLLRSRLDEMPQQAWLDRGERAATKLAEQLNCLVDVFYLAERYNALEVSSVGLGPLFWRLRHENKDCALQRGIDLRAISTNANVVSNPVLLDCILRNLLTNAIRYTEPGGRILIGPQGARNQDRCIRHGHRHSGRPIAANLRILHAPRARTRQRFGYRALYRSTRARGAWPPDRGPIGRG